MLAAPVAASAQIQERVDMILRRFSLPGLRMFGLSIFVVALGLAMACGSADSGDGASDDAAPAEAAAA